MRRRRAAPRQPPPKRAERHGGPFTRSYAAIGVQPGSSVWLVAADAWNGTYRSLGQAFRENTEDGYVHVARPKGAGGCTPRAFPRHAADRDAARRRPRVFCRRRPPLELLERRGVHVNGALVGGGGSFTYKRREWPHLLDKAGNPVYLTNGVVPGVAADWSFTGVYAIRGGGGG
jgi:hypothetical protein